MKLQARLGGAFLLLAGLAVLGCKQENPNAPARVTGRVLYKGNPVTGGMLAFHPTGGGIISIPIGADGSYSAFDIPDGDMVVTVETESINPDKKTPDYKGASGGAAAMYGGKAAGGGGMVAKGQQNSPAPEGAIVSSGTYMKVPAKYADPATSGLTVTLKKGEQKHDVTLTD